MMLQLTDNQWSVICPIIYRGLLYVHYAGREIPKLTVDVPKSVADGLRTLVTASVHTDETVESIYKSLGLELPSLHMKDISKSIFNDVHYWDSKRTTKDFMAQIACSVKKYEKHVVLRYLYTVWAFSSMGDCIFMCPQVHLGYMYQWLTSDSSTDIDVIMEYMLFRDIENMFDAHKLRTLRAHAIKEVLNSCNPDNILKSVPIEFSSGTYAFTCEQVLNLVGVNEDGTLTSGLSVLQVYDLGRGYTGVEYTMNGKIESEAKILKLLKIGRSFNMDVAGTSYSVCVCGPYVVINNDIMLQVIVKGKCIGVMREFLDKWIPDEDNPANRLNASSMVEI